MFKLIFKNTIDMFELIIKNIIEIVVKTIIILPFFTIPCAVPLIWYYYF